jgi:peptide/nickel transport system permease protein
MAPVLVAMTLGIPAAILTESGLSFLGLGVQPPHATWGNILNEGKEVIGARLVALGLSRRGPS